MPVTSQADVSARCLGSDSSSHGNVHTGQAPPFREALSPLPVSVTSLKSSREYPHVPGYEIDGELGRGGMGVVYRARQLSLNRWVALKVLHFGTDGDPSARTRLRIEAEAAGRLQHPNVVQIFEVGEFAGHPYLALEHVSGGSLESWVDGGVRHERESARIVESLARAVHHAHDHGILHRDLKPANVLLTAEQTPKITDFGLAKFIEQESGPTRSEAVIGTPSYMAPEQAAGDNKQVGPATDVYSLGAILYELLTGCPPFRGPSPLNTLELVRNRDPVAPRRVRADISFVLETICLRCLEKKPGNRYSTAASLADDLGHFLAGMPIRAQRTPSWRRLGRSVRRRPTLVAGLVGIAAVICLLIASIWYARNAERLDRQRAEDRYQEFTTLRNDAYFYGLLAPEDGTVFRCGEARPDWRIAESSARDALRVAGVDPESPSPHVDPAFAPSRASEVTADCYSLLLILARAQGDRTKEALALLNCASRLGLETRALHEERSRVLHQMGRLEEARNEEDLARSIRPEIGVDQLLVGEEHYRRGEWALAQDAFHRVLAAHPGHFWAQFLLAVSQLKTQEWAAARAGFSACLCQQRGCAWAYLFRSLASEKLGSLPDAEADFRSAVGLARNVEAHYSALLTRGVFRFDQRDLDGATADLHAAIVLMPDQYNAYFSVAHVCLERGRFEEAENHFRTGRQLKPPTQAIVGYHADRARCMLRTGRPEQSLRECDEALRLAPERPHPLATRAKALLTLGRYAQAERAFDACLATKGNRSSDLYRGRGQARMHLGKYPEAADDYTRALVEEPDGELYLHRGWANYFSDSGKLALRDFNRAIDLDPAATDARIGRGLASIMLGDTTGAIADAETALRRPPATPEMMHNLACIFAQAATRVAGSGLVDSANAYRRRAVEVVRRTLELLGPDERTAFWRDKILTDSALSAIRDEPDFRCLQLEFDNHLKPTER
jgi:tetratricopeptide (TPR) repeat protein